MPLRGLNWQTINLRFANGLQQKADDRARPSVFLDRAVDVQFDERGGIQTRKSFLSFSNSIFGGGTLSNCRRLAVVNDELCVFTDTSLYSWNAQQLKWVLRGTHLAASVEERPAFVTNGDQTQGDRAELSGAITYAWVEGNDIRIAAIDKTTGSVIAGPIPQGLGIVTVARPRVVALATKVLVFCESNGALVVFPIDPTSPTLTSVAAVTVLAAGTFNSYYDVVKVEGQDLAIGVARRATTTSYTVFTVTPALVVTTSTKARTADGPLAVATTPSTGAQTQVVRGNGTNIQGDLLTTSTLADVTVNEAIGTATSATINQIAVSFASATVVRAFWTSGASGENTTGATFEVKSNTVTAGTPGSQGTFVLMAGIASRAFTYAGNVYIWVAFAQENVVTGLSGAVSVGVRAQVQNTYFLYRDDRLLVGKALFDVAGGHSALTGHLPSVAPTSGTGLDFAWCGTRRRIIEVGGDAHEGFEARSPTDVRFSFDSNLSRRSAALGRTLYVTDSIPLQYDGVGLFEVGFLIYPYDFFVTTGGAGSIVAGDYIYKSTLAWPNAQDERERSTTAMGAKITAPGANKNAIQISALNYTRKTAAGAVPTVEVWRTPVNPPDDAPFYLVSGKDPNVLAGGGTNNAYVPNDVNASFVPSTGFFTLGDSFADTTLTTKEKNPENGSVLEALAPPGASIIIATDTRLFLAGVPGDADAVWYSRLRNEGEIASFHDGNRILVPRLGGSITAIAFIDKTLVVFRETAIYAFVGNGVDNLGQGGNFELLRTVSSDLGAESQEAVALTPHGLLFKARKGWHFLPSGGQPVYVGAAVSDYDSETVHATTHLESHHQVRILSGTRLIVWDYGAVTEESPLGQWFEWTVANGIDALNWQGVYTILTATGPAQLRDTYTGADFGLDVETAWVKPDDLQGASAIQRFQPLGEYRSAFLLRSRVSYNYNPTVVDDRVWTPSPTTVGGPLQFSHALKYPHCEAVKIRLTAVAAGVQATLNAGTSATLVVAKLGGTNRWGAIWRAVAVGELGNALAMNIAVDAETSPPFAIDVRDHFRWVVATQTWEPAPNTIGVRLRLNQISAGRPTMAQLEAAIVAGTALATLVTPDPSPALTVDAAVMFSTTVSDTFVGGTFTSPSGEALKLTGLALKVGIEGPLYNRLPTSQKV